MHALVIDGQVVRVGPLPSTWRTGDGQVVAGWPAADPAVHRAAGWLPVTDARPALEAGQAWGPTVWIVGETEATMTAEAIAVASEPTALDLLAGLPPDQAEAMATLALGLVGRAGDLWDALVAMPPDDPAVPAVQIVTDAALTAALPLTPQEDPSP